MLCAHLVFICGLVYIQMQCIVIFTTYKCSAFHQNTYVVGILNFCRVAMPFDSMHDSIVTQLLLVG